MDSRSRLYVTSNNALVVMDSRDGASLACIELPDRRARCVLLTRARQIVVSVGQFDETRVEPTESLFVLSY